MREADITDVMENYIKNQEMSGGALMVRKEGKLVYQNKWGYANLEKKTPIEYNSIYRLMSMSKCITGVAVMKLYEAGKIDLDAPVSVYIPEFAHMRVAKDTRYQMDENLKIKHVLWKLFTFRMDKVKSIASDREITIRDLLSHASGLEQGVAGLMAFMKMKPTDQSLEERVMRYSRYVLDFQPGTATSYSPLAGFDILGYIVGKVSGMGLESYLKKEIFEPLEMKDTFFYPNEEQQRRVVRLYKRKKQKLIDVTDSKNDTHQFMRHGNHRIESGSGGLYGTITDYEKLSEMLCNEGVFKEKQFLKSKTVQLMHTEAQENHLESEPGQVWGLSVKIRQDPKAAGSFAHAGTYGWSGAFGTHFFVCPDEKMEAVFTTNRSDLGGSGSYISRKVEEMVFGIWGNECFFH